VGGRLRRGTRVRQQLRQSSTVVSDLSTTTAAAATAAIIPSSARALSPATAAGKNYVRFARFSSVIGRMMTFIIFDQTRI